MSTFPGTGSGRSTVRSQDVVGYSLLVGEDEEGTLRMLSAYREVIDGLGRISKRGDGYIRRLLVHGARTVLRWRRAKPGTRPGWTDQLLARRPTNVVLVAMANKTARVAWALLRYERIYQPVSA